VAAPATPAELQLAQRLRHLREGAGITQAQLAAAFNAEDPVRPATVSTWESLKTSSTPPEARLEPYARFFASPRSLEGEPHLLPIAELVGDQKGAYDELLADLRRLWEVVRGPRQDQAAPSTRRSWFFDDPGSVTIICPDAPAEARGPLFSTTDPNFTRAHLYADLDALIELHGHIRAENGSEYPVFHLLASEADADDLSGHVVLTPRDRMPTPGTRLHAAIENPRNDPPRNLGPPPHPLRRPGLHERSRRHHRPGPRPIIHHQSHQRHPSEHHRPDGIFPPPDRPTPTAEPSMNSSNASTRPDGHAPTPASTSARTSIPSPSNATTTTNDHTHHRSC
jgi:transcriptional regulator with XRE-family HTH domain